MPIFAMPDIISMVLDRGCTAPFVGVEWTKTLVPTKLRFHLKTLAQTYHVLIFPVHIASNFVYAANISSSSVDEQMHGPAVPSGGHGRPRHDLAALPGSG